MSKIALVIPTIRENCFRDFVARWEPLGLFELCDLILMEDNPNRTFSLNSVMEKPDRRHKHLCWVDISNDLSDSEHIIPRRSDTVRSYAYYYAWAEGDYDYILTLDDDCYPPQMDVDGYEYKDAAEFINMHISGMSGKTKWFNTLNSVKPRGIPFYNRGLRDDIIVNHGLWTNVVDYDAPTQLVNPIPEQFDFSTAVVPHGSYFPLCGMNVMYKREASVLMYHLLMGQVVTKIVTPGNVGQTNLRKLALDRFGDIWCGLFMKKIADMTGKSVSTGTPYIRHERASNPFTNLKKEAHGLEINEKLWEYVDNFTSSKTSYIDLYFDLGAHISKFDEFIEHVEYFKELGEAMRIWSELFRE